MQCLRCNGLMVLERYDNILDDTGQINLDGLRCLICGEIIDPIILSNRMAVGPVPVL